jgi:mRNA interferase RelE/StbE
MAYEVVWDDEAEKAFQKIDKAIQRRIQRVVDRLVDNPRPGQATSIMGDPSTLRVKSGDWRILYEIHHDRQRVVILAIRHRSKAYRPNR